MTAGSCAISTSQDCADGSYQTITSFMPDLFSNGGGGILWFQDRTTDLTSAQRSELDAALAKAPYPASTPASSPAHPGRRRTHQPQVKRPPRTPQSSGSLLSSDPPACSRRSWCRRPRLLLPRPVPAQAGRDGARRRKTSGQYRPCTQLDQLVGTFAGFAPATFMAACSWARTGQPGRASCRSVRM